jgi:adenylate cyclase
MSVEIEYKFLVATDWREHVDIEQCKQSCILQGYLTTNPNKTIRVRIRDDRAYLTIKGRQTGISRAEYEYEIPFGDGMDIIKMCDHTIAKTRYEYIDEHDQLWEIDVFAGCHEGLVLAELEVSAEDRVICTPDWIGVDVSDDFRYTNAHLASHWVKK